ncbi:hypothetical protein DL96DRAFT_722980 [Flagelloscypha sp. PMI_526]|nr:hypothetical protein DL96DRAFT_722980 [Flagelloscypha sp. PMI_526]
MVSIASSSAPTQPQPDPAVRNEKPNGFMRRLTTKLRPGTSASPAPSLPPSAPAPPLPPRSNTPPVPTSSSRGVQSKRNSILNALPSLPALPQARSAPAVSAFTNQDARTAALRERGLLPQLSLSEQEARQDARIVPIPAPSVPGETNSELGTSATESRMLSAADRIKEEWESKAQAAEIQEKERMKSFKFGGESPTTVTAVPSSATGPPPPSPLKLRFPVPVTLPPASPPPRSPLPSPPTSPTLSNAEGASIRSWPSQQPMEENTTPTTLKQKTIPPPLNLKAKSKVGKENTELAPIPTPASFYESAPQTPRSPWMDLPLPPSPLPSPGIAMNGILMSTEAGTTSLHPPSLVNDTISNSYATSEADTVSSWEPAPSLTSSAPTLSTSHSLSSPDPSLDNGLRARSGSRTRDIPAIAENPSEELGMAAESLTTLRDTTTPKSSAPPSLAEESVESVPSNETPSTQAGKDQKKRRSLLNPFKRASTVKVVDSDNEAKSDRRRSTSSFRLGRSKSTAADRGKGFDASHLPPSPSVPGFSANSIAPPTATVTRRTSVFDKQYQGAARLMDREGIISEMEKIEDEESQRLTESAFLL